MTIMSTKFAIIGVVSVLGVGTAMHHARFCPLRAMMTAMHHHVTPGATAKAPAGTKPAEKPATNTVALR
jgi:hypothetical protein